MARERMNMNMNMDVKVKFPPSIVGGYGVRGYSLQVRDELHRDIRGGQDCSLPIKFNVSGLISRGLGRKRAFFATFLTLNHLDFS